MNEWHGITLWAMIDEYPTKTKLECFDTMTSRLRRVVPGLPSSMRASVDGTMRDQVLRGCRGIPECSLAVYQPNATYEGLCADIRNAISVKALEMTNRLQQFSMDENDEMFWTDRTFGRSRPSPDRGRGRGRGLSRGRGFGNDRLRPPTTKKCYVCGKVGCWSTKHTLEERKTSYNRYRDNAHAMNNRPSAEAYNTFLVNFKGFEMDDHDEHDDYERDDRDWRGRDKHRGDAEIEFGGEEEGFFAEIGPLEPLEVLARLDDHAVLHAITGIDQFNADVDANTRTHPHTGTTEGFTLGRYDDVRFQGILPDTGAAGVSTAGEKQTRALMRLRPDIRVNRLTAGDHIVHFGKGSTTSIGTIEVPTPIGRINFEVVPTSTPFL